jgi:hypothetical protein
MARTKKSEPENELVLNGDLFWRWKAMFSDFERLTVMLQAKVKELEVALAQVPEIRIVMEQRVALAAELSTAKAELLVVQKEIESVLGIKIENCAIDDRTGRIYNLEADGTKTPAKKQRGNKTPKTEKKGR